MTSIPPSDASEDTAQGSSTTNQPASFAEWISLAIASLILMGVIGLVIHLWISDQQRQPPILQVTTQKIRESNRLFYVPFEVRNVGGKTAESVQVLATLTIGDHFQESGEQTINFLSSQERATGTFVFSRSPEQGTLIIRVAGYQDP